MVMRLYLDSANLKEVQLGAELGYLDGVTTNPQLVADEEADLEELIPEICARIGGTVSVPVKSVQAPGMILEARELSQLHDNVVVKMPIHREGLRAMAALATEGVRTHATLCCTAAQALLAAKCGAWFVSPFLARLEQEGERGLGIIAEILEIFEAYDFETRVMVASLRNVRQVVELARLGVDGCTMSLSLLEQLASHPLSRELNNAYAEAGADIL